MTRRPEVPALYRTPGEVAGAAMVLIRQDLTAHGLDPEFFFDLRANRVAAPFRLEYWHSKYIRRGAVYSAHALRLAADALPEGDRPLWASTIDAARWTFSSSSADKRRPHGLAIRRALIGEHAHPHLVDAAEGLGKWLGANVQQDYLATATRVARWAISHVDEHLRDAWYATHGLYLLRQLRKTAPSGAGRPSLDTADVRTAQRLLARRTFAALAPTRTRLAEDAGVTRVTLNAWLSD